MSENANQILALYKLKNEGSITSEEFEKLKLEILSPKPKSTLKPVIINKVEKIQNNKNKEGIPTIIVILTFMFGFFLFINLNPWIFASGMIGFFLFCGAFGIPLIVILLIVIALKKR